MCLNILLTMPIIVLIQIKGFIMAGSSLGIGSGVLTADVLDQLRTADDTVILKPIEGKLAIAKQKEEAATLLSSFMTTFKTSTSSLGNENLYLGREVSGSDDFVSVTAQAGSDMQSFNITDVSKAEKNVLSSVSSFSSTTDPIYFLGSGTLTVKIGTKELAIDYTPTTSLDSIKNSINDALGADITAKNLKIGDSTYSFSLSANNLNEAISFSDSNEGDDGLATILNLKSIQDAKPATFKFNGIEITRSTNDISDLVNGVTITLNKNQVAGTDLVAGDSSSIKVGQSETAIKTDMELFVTNYNLLASNLKDMTLYDAENKVAGIFNSESFIKSITRELSNIISRTNTDGKSLTDYGIEISRDGVMSLDSSKFAEKLSSDPTALELFFRGDSETDGIFKTLDDKMQSYTGSSQLLSGFTTQLGTETANLISEYDKQKASLDARYETMTKRFTAYDAMISKLNNQFASLQMIIDAQSSTTTS